MVAWGLIGLFLLPVNLHSSFDFTWKPFQMVHWKVSVHMGYG